MADAGPVTGSKAAARRPAPVRSSERRPLVAAFVGVDGSGKSSLWRLAVEVLAQAIHVAGIGDTVIAGGPGVPVAERADVPLSRSARIIGAFAKGLRRPELYKNLKFVELAERSRIETLLAATTPLDVILTDGHPLVNCAAWSAARYYRADLAGDEDLARLIGYLAGEVVIPASEVARLCRRAWQLVLANRLGLARLTPPGIVFFLDLPPSVAMERIRARGRPLQAHETENFLGDLSRAYARVCALLEERWAVPVVRLAVDRMPLEAAVDRVMADLLARSAVPPPAAGAHPLPDEGAPTERSVENARLCR